MTSTSHVTFFCFFTFVTAAYGNTLPAINNANVRTPILPPFVDPYYIPDQVDVEIDTEYALGKYSIRNAKVVGLGNMTNDFHFIIVIGNTTFRINAPSAVIDGDYDINVTITLPQMDPFTVVGDGKFSFSLINGMGFITYILPINGKLELRNLQIYLDFDTFEGHADNFKINDELVDWEAFSENAKPIFESIWDPIRDPLIETITNVVNGIIGDCTLIEDIVPWLMGGGEMPDCLVFSTLPPTGPTEPTDVPSTTASTGVPTYPTTPPVETSSTTDHPNPSDPTTTELSTTTMKQIIGHLQLALNLTMDYALTLN